MNAVDTACDLVQERFPEASAAFLGGSVLTAARTATSDLDIVVLLPGPPAPFRETLRHRDWLVELFVHTTSSYARYTEKKVAAGRSPLLHMCGAGVVVVDADGSASRTQRDARERLAAGPPPTSDGDLERRRYAISSLLDDLVGTGDQDELVFIAGSLLVATAELVLVARRCWLGTDKWLIRHLRDADPALSARLLDTYRAVIRSGERETFEAVVRDALDAVGGRVMDGYYRAGCANP